MKAPAKSRCFFVIRVSPECVWTGTLSVSLRSTALPKGEPRTMVYGASGRPPPTWVTQIKRHCRGDHRSPAGGRGLPPLQKRREQVLAALDSFHKGRSKNGGRGIAGGHRDPPLRAHQLIFCGAQYIIHRRVYIISHKRYIIRDRRARISLRATQACGAQKTKGLLRRHPSATIPQNYLLTQISSMIAISAASPRRGPILVIRT